MELYPSIRQILKLSVPIMMGSAVQNIIALSDSVLLFHKGKIDFAAIGLVSIFLLNHILYWLRIFKRRTDNHSPKGWPRT